MRDVHLAGFVIESNYVIRFRSRDHKPATVDTMVGVGLFTSYSNANRALLNLIKNNDQKIKELASLEVDKTLFDTVSSLFFYHTLSKH